MKWWRVWLLGSMAWNTVACGDAGAVREEASVPRGPAQPQGVGSDAENQATGDGGSAHAGPSSARQPAGTGFEGNSDTHSRDPDPSGEESVGWEAPRCGGSATRRITIVGNLDAAAPLFSELSGSFSPEDPISHANFAASVSAFDDQGRRQTLIFYFERTTQGWNYHAMLDGTTFVIGEGHLSFDDHGYYAGTEVTKELRLLTAEGPGHAVELDLSGFTRVVGTNSIQYEYADGREARWGALCADESPLPGEPSVEGPRCATRATTRVAFRANLASELSMAFSANDAFGTVVDFELALRQIDAQTWSYQVLGEGAAASQEVASGSLHFNSNGSLRSVRNARELRFPNREGQLGGSIALDFGEATEQGGNGVDGVTALSGSSFEIWHQPDGSLLACLPSSVPSTLWKSRRPSCAGEWTNAVQMYFNLDPAAPPGETYRFGATLLDSALQPHDYALRFQRTEGRRWLCHVEVDGEDVSRVDLEFHANGQVVQPAHVAALRLPLADGSTGPAIDLGFADAWAITSFDSSTAGWLQPNGSALGAEGCVD